MKHIFLYLNLTLWAFSISASPGDQLEIKPFLTNYFDIDPIPLEKSVYTALQKAEIQYNGEYIAFPWSVCLSYNWLDKLPNIIVKNGVTVCQHVWFERMIPTFKKMGIKTVFATSAPNNKNYDGINIVPYPLFPVNGVRPAQNKDIFYSFIGFLKTHPVRSRLMQIKHPSNCVMIARKDYYFSNKLNKDRAQFQNTLSRSRFSLCPRGTGPNSVRFWESLQAGAIPVLISDDLMLPTVIDWDSCIIRVAENEINTIPDTLKNITAEREAAMRKSCYEVFKFFFENPITYIKLVLDNLSKESANES